MKATFYILISALIITACNSGEENLIVVENYIEVDLQQYFDSFKVEAAKFGISVDYQAQRVDGYIRNINDRGVAGQCQTFEGGLSAVIISPSYWNSIEGLQREFLVYHELGHCILARDHLDEPNADGTCKSLMSSGSEDCFLNYNNRTKEEYLEELFTNL